MQTPFSLSGNKPSNLSLEGGIERQRQRYQEIRDEQEAVLEDEAITSTATRALPKDFIFDRMTEVIVVAKPKHPDHPNDSTQRYSLRFTNHYRNPGSTSAEAVHEDVLVAEASDGELERTVKMFSLDQAAKVVGLAEELEIQRDTGFMPDLRPDLAGIEAHQREA